MSDSFQNPYPQDRTTGEGYQDGTSAYKDMSIPPEYRGQSQEVPYYPPDAYQQYHQRREFIQPQPNMVQPVVPGKKWLTAFLLLLFLSGFSAHRFYSGKIGTAILQLLFCWGGIVSFFILGSNSSGTASNVWLTLMSVLSLSFYIWILIDFIQLVRGKMTDNKGVSLYRNPIRGGDKSWVKTFFYCAFLGIFGWHRFYVGRKLSGSIQLFFFCGAILWLVLGMMSTGTGVDAFFYVLFILHLFILWFVLAIWLLVDYVMLLNETFKDSKGFFLSRDV